MQSPDPRVCTWAEFTHKESGARFRYFNTHLDHLSPIARGKGARVIFEHMAACQAREKLPLFWGGDFNFTPRAALYAECLRQTVAEGRLVDLTGAIPTTFHWFGALKRPLKLDYVFADEATAGDALSVRLVPTDAAGGFVSDHHAIRLDWDPGAPRPERPAEAPAHPWEGAPAPAL